MANKVFAAQTWRPALEWPEVMGKHRYVSSSTPRLAGQLFYPNLSTLHSLRTCLKKNNINSNEDRHLMSASGLHTLVHIHMFRGQKRRSKSEVCGQYGDQAIALLHQIV